MAKSLKSKTQSTFVHVHDASHWADEERANHDDRENIQVAPSHPEHQQSHEYLRTGGPCHTIGFLLPDFDVVSFTSGSHFPCLFLENSPTKDSIEQIKGEKAKTTSTVNLRVNPNGSGRLLAWEFRSIPLRGALCMRLI